MIERLDESSRPFAADEHIAVDGQVTGLPEPPPMNHRPWWLIDPAGSLLGLVAAVCSATPSLLPRPTTLQGILTGIAFAIGYLLGVAIWSIVRALLRGKARQNMMPRRWWFIYAAVWVLAIAVLSSLAVMWQNEVRSLVSMQPLDGSDLAGFLFAFLPTVVVLLLAGKGSRIIYLRFRRRTGTPVAALLSTGTVTVAVGGLILGAVAGVDRVYHDRNAHPDPEAVQPVSEHRSAGPGSAIAWETLGRHGATFVSGGPDAADIESLTGQEAIEPIRVYAGLGSAPTVEERAALVVDELERTGAFERKILAVATTTGSGWLEPQTMDALEYLHSGDTAIAAMQYAYTPSWVSFVFEPDAPVEAARVLFDAVEARWEQLPEDDRPHLIAYGLSLGAHGSQAVFTGVADLRSRADGALFVGSPNGSPLWRNLQAARDPGSPAWQPVLDSGREVRWMSRAGDEAHLSGTWYQPRVLYLQHATDPVTWLSPELLWRAPEWLESDQRSSDVSSSMRWIPILTGLQVTIDMLVGEAVPAAYGHNYGDVVLTAWQQVTPDTGLDSQVINKIQAEIESYSSIPRYEE